MGGEGSGPNAQMIRLCAGSAFAALLRNAVSYETALATVFRAMGDEMPEKFGVCYLYDRPKPDAPGA